MAIPTHRNSPTLQNSAHLYGDVFRLRFAFLYSYMFTHPDVSHEILARQAQAFEKDPITHRSLGRIIHKGLTVNEGEPWKRQRRLMQPAFHVSRINTYVQMMVQYTAQMLASWREGETFDINQELIALTLRIVAQALFGTDVKESASQVSKSCARSALAIASAEDRMEPVDCRNCGRTKFMSSCWRARASFTSVARASPRRPSVIMARNRASEGGISRFKISAASTCVRAGVVKRRP